LEPVWLDPVGFEAFEIRPSTVEGERSTLVLPDIATCPDCLKEVFDPGDRRFRYPFTNCVNCGPRFSILRALPYDRPNTSMTGFEMCGECRVEYDDPANRRFHAQPNACPECGPQLAWWDEAGRELATRDDALNAAVAAISAGAIVAVKGLGGFHLMCLCHTDAVLGKLRQRKGREEKPFAVMFPDLASVRTMCRMSPLEARLLESPESPMVLLRGKDADEKTSTRMSGLVAPGTPWLGVMLPYTPLHHLLLHEIGIPLVATSGNLSDEPICTDEREAVERLSGIADFYLVHDRPIVRHVDDSIVRVAAGRELVMRRARGYAPLPVTIPTNPSEDDPESLLAVGAHLKSTVALAVGNQAFISQHIGDLETATALQAFERVTTDLQVLYDAQASRLVADAHPDYLSTRFARQRGLPWTRVQHHLAHVLSCMAENELPAPVLGVAWDGTGFGLDETVWGGEFIQVERKQDRVTWNRVAHLRRFRLPGGELAVKEPRRAALGLLHELGGESWTGEGDCHSLQAFQPSELVPLRQMLERGLYSPQTSSAGRLFDAVASLTGLRQTVRHEGQAAMQLEFIAEEATTREAYPLPLVRGRGLPPEEEGGVLDWSPLIEALLADVAKALPVSVISARFHNALADGIVRVAQQAQLQQVVLSGGCFQNKRLLESAIRELRNHGFRPYWHQRVPTNDGGLALGQVVAARWGLGLH
jgi:hydrogenase maturation protein HypF